MKSCIRCLVVFVFACFACAGLAVDDPVIGGNGPCQDAADAIRAFVGSDGAFLAAGLVRPSFEKDNLASLLKYPTETIVVLNLTGAQIRQAFERSVALFPQPNENFLQISGFEVSFNKNGPPNSRIVSITANGAKLDNAKTYTVAMPSSLARGGLGFFRIWDYKTSTAKSIDNTTVESVLQGKRSTGSASRWQAQ
jgi:2',3'-cyclic-nucleotide 2'-phosphodiesterase (5'-nucleotidase family)